MVNAFERAFEFLVQPDVGASGVELALRRVPLVGVALANIIKGYRARPIVQGVQAELLGRRRPATGVWGDSFEKAAFAQSISELAMLEMGWVNDHFLPGDQAAVVFWNHRDSLDFATTIKDIELNFGVTILDSDIARWSGHSLGEMVDDLWLNRLASESDSVPWPPAPEVPIE